MKIPVQTRFDCRGGPCDGLQVVFSEVLIPEVMVLEIDANRITYRKTDVEGLVPLYGQNIATSELEVVGEEVDIIDCFYKFEKLKGSAHEY